MGPSGQPPSSFRQPGNTDRMQDRLLFFLGCSCMCSVTRDSAAHRCFTLNLPSIYRVVMYPTGPYCNVTHPPDTCTVLLLIATSHVCEQALLFPYRTHRGDYKRDSTKDLIGLISLMARWYWRENNRACFKKGASPTINMQQIVVKGWITKHVNES